jgi:hypothetical protein
MERLFARYLGMPPLLLSLAAACVHQPAPDQFQLPPGAIPYREFPEATTRAVPNGKSVQEVPVSSITAQCGRVSSLPDSTHLVTVLVPDPRVSRLEFDLPAGYGPVNNYPLSASVDSAHGSYLLAHFSDAAGRIGSSRDQARASHLAIWIGPEPGFATVGADTATRQVAYGECHAGSSSYDPYVAAFTLRMPGAGPANYVSAVWPLSRGRYLRALASSDRLQVAETIRAALIRGRIVKRGQ